MSAGAGSLPICVTPGIPVSSACTMSVRFVSLIPRLSSWFSAAAGNGLRTYLPKLRRSSCGCVRLNLSFSASGITSSLISGLPSRLTWTQRAALRCAARRS